MTRPTAASFSMLLLAAAFAACAEASGEVRGGGEEQDTSAQLYLGCDPTEQIDAGNGTAWADLYRDLFSAGGSAGCGQPGTGCHGSDKGNGFIASSFLCADEVGCRDSIRTTLLRFPADKDDPENSGLVTIMRHCDDDRRRIGLMPKEPKNYFFSRKSVDRVKTWIAAGAPD
jgi:hypothetical protein